MGEITMHTWSQRTGDDSAFPPLPWEHPKVSPAEYARSLQSLARFLLEVGEASQICTIEDLSAVASLVGHDLYTITITKGKAVEGAAEQLDTEAYDALRNAERHYRLTKFLRDRQIAVTSGSGHVCISEKSRVGWQGYQREELRVRLPSTGDIAIGVRPNVDEQSIYAIDLRGGARREYHPVREPLNADAQGGFAHLLRDAVMDLVATLA
jgi:hypothetical protein